MTKSRYSIFTTRWHVKEKIINFIIDSRSPKRDETFYELHSDAKYRNVYLTETRTTFSDES